MLSVTARKEAEEEVSGKALVNNTPSMSGALTGGDTAASTSETVSSLAAVVEVDHDPKLQSSTTETDSSTLTPSERGERFHVNSNWTWVSRS